MHGGIGALAFHGNIIDVGTGLGDFCRHLGQYTALIGCHHFDADLEQSGDVFVPRHIQPVIRIAMHFGDHRTVAGMNHQSLVLLDEADDEVARGAAGDDAQDYLKHVTEAQAADLDGAWEVLAEPIQTVMRRHGLPEPYEQLKAFTRGAPMTRELMRGFIDRLVLPAAEKARLLAMTPAELPPMASTRGMCAAAFFRALLMWS